MDPNLLRIGFGAKMWELCFVISLDAGGKLRLAQGNHLGSEKEQLSGVRAEEELIQVRV